MFRTERNKGIFLVTSAAVIWGVGYPFWKLLVFKINPLALTSLTFIISTFFISALHNLNYKEIYIKFKQSVLVVVMLGISAGVFATSLNLFALKQLDAGIVSFLEKLQPIFTLIVARLFLKERFSANKIPFVIASLFLAFAISLKDPLSVDIRDNSFIAIFAGIASALFYGSNIVMCKHLGNSGLQPIEIAFLRMLFGGVFSLIFIFNSDTQSELLALTNTDIIMLVSVSYITLVLGFNIFLSGLRYLEAGTTSILELITPIVALSTGLLFFGESLNKVQIVAIPIFIWCIIKLTKEE